MGKHNSYSLWFTASCYKKFLATFICRSHNEISGRKGHLVSAQSNYFCDKDWFLLNSTSKKCYGIFKAPDYLSFQIADTICYSMNSSVLRLNTVYSIPKDGEYTYIMIHDLKMELKYIYHMEIPKYLNDSLLASTVVGMAVKRNSQSQLLRMMKIFFMDYTLPVRINKLCGIVQYSAFYSMLMTDVDSMNTMHGWGAKYKRCNDVIHADILICEKQSQLSSFSMCGAQYYHCNDGTCVLTIYKCDFLVDCVDGDDEHGCPTNIIKNDEFVLINDTLYLPCQIYPVHSICEYLNTSVILKPLKIHAVCDGIDVESSVLMEGESCLKRAIKHINKTELIMAVYTVNKDMPGTNINLDTIAANLALSNFTLWNEQKYGVFQTETNVTIPFFDNFKISCQESFKTFSDMCQIKAHDKQCAFLDRSLLCGDVACPGMFKCERYYCLYMSLVCDGQIDCLYGEDEQYCSNTSCPGLLRCRGEIRCLSSEQICDGNVDCVSSFDDEIICNQCPSNCQCNGYIMQCVVSNSLGDLQHLQSLYAKGVVLKGTQQIVSLDLLSTLSILYIDISFCDVESIVFPYNSYAIDQFLLFADFSNNRLNDTKFVTAAALKKLVVLDLGYNAFNIISNKYFRLSFLLLLDLTSNPVHIIMINSNKYMYSLKLLNLRYVKFTMDLLVIPKEDAVLEVKVSDYNLCCLLSQQLRCTYEGRRNKCYGLIDSSPTAIVFCCLLVAAVTLTTISTLKILWERNNRSGKKHYNIVKLNHIVSESISTLSLICISGIGMKDINLLGWKRSTACYLINTMFSISLGTTMTFKVISMFVVGLKIIYPFGHRLLRVKKMAFLTSLIWVSVHTLYGAYTIVVQLQNKFVLLDKYCSIGDCDFKVKGKPILIFVCSVNLSAMLAFLMLIYCVTVTLQKKNESHIMKRRTNVLKVVFFLSIQLLAQVSFTINLCVIILMKIVINSGGVNYCFAVLSHVLAICILLGGILNMIM